jgi:pyruvate dehydrogenase E2 component (dihydrolipoamide acetyltransferase)
VDIQRVRGSGPHGRVLREDVGRFARGEEPAAPVGEPPREAPPLEVPTGPLPSFDQYGKIRREKPAQIRKTIARQMTRAWLNVPRVTHCDDADVTELERNRKQYNGRLQEGETKLTMTATVIKAVAAALHRHPMVNCTYDAQNEEIIYKDYVHLGIAVDTPRGLVVPVIRDVDRKPLTQLGRELRDVAERTRTAKFDIAELRGATFTITNVGALGGSFVTPMVNFPEVGILALGRAVWRPKVMEDMSIVPRLILPLSLSFDHRIVDGADAARFVRDVIDSLENPLRLLG